MQYATILQGTERRGLGCIKWYTGRPMGVYTFENISPPDFEILVRDLLQAEFGITLESFKWGADKGIDLRHCWTDKDRLVVQCKRYIQTSFKTLLKRVTKEELPKVQKLNPKRYILATALPLNPDQKEKLFEALKPYCSTPADIVDCSTLNGLLAKFPNIETTHFKLWLTSIPVLEKLLHQDVLLQTGWKSDSILQRLKTYVANDSFNHAQEVLNKYHNCIISGAPGIGKSTLAEVLVADYMRNGFEFTYILNETSEAKKLMGTDTRRIIYFDDFLGKNYLGQRATTLKDQPSLLQLLDHARKSPNLRVILATREYILRQAKEDSESLNHPKFDLAKVTIDLSNYTKPIRAKILYNHLYYSDIGQEYKKSILKGKAYRTLLVHPGFNPRIIEHLCDPDYLTDVAPADYVSFCLESLRTPLSIWEHAFSNHLSRRAKTLVTVLATFEGFVPYQELESAYWSYYTILRKTYGAEADPDDFRRALKEVDGTFTQSIEKEGTVLISFHNPSLVDFLMHHISNNLNSAIDLLDSCVYFEQTAVIIERLEAKDTTMRSDCIYRAIERTFEKDCSKFLTNNHTIFRHGCNSLEWKIGHLVKMIRSDVKFSVTFAQNLAQILRTNIQDGALDVNALRTIMLMLKHAEEHSGERMFSADDNLNIENAINGFLAQDDFDFSSLEDVDFVMQYATESGSNLPLVRKKFEEFVRDEVGRIKEQFSESGEVRSYADDLEQRALDLDALVGRSIDRIREKASEIDAAHDDDGYTATSRADESAQPNDDVEIDALFDSLIERL
jgi:hypothetical protein